MSTIQTIGIDLAKNVFSIHGVDPYGKCVLRKTVKRNKMLETFANLPPCLVGMEVCSGAHHWARELSKLGHIPRIMASKFDVLSYLKPLIFTKLGLVYATDSLKLGAATLQFECLSVSFEYAPTVN
tara:strand:+ start:1026 stop:1403 length:378 start_codon:yes stop_codon:yes gene_type:complete